MLRIRQILLYMIILYSVKHCTTSQGRMILQLLFLSVTIYTRSHQNTWICSFLQR